MIKLITFTIIFAVYTLIIVPFFPVVEVPAGFVSLYYFPALFAIGDLPVLGTLVAILHWVLVFEAVYFVVKLGLRLLEWTGFTGASYLER